MPGGIVPDAVGSGGGEASNPFGMLNALTDFQLKMNQNKQFQAQFMANQAIGETVAHSNSLEEGLENLQKSPMAPMMFGFGGQAIESLKAARALELQGANTSQAMSTSGYQNVLQAGLASMNDPMNYDKYFKSALQAVDPMVRERVRPMIQAVEDSIGQKISGYNLSDPQQAAAAKSAVASMVGGAFVGAGGDPSHLAPFMGQIMETPQGPVKTPGILQQGSQGPAGLISTGTGPGGGGTIEQAKPQSYTAPNGDVLSVNPGPVAAQYMEKDRNGNIAYQNGVPVLNPNLQEHNQELLKDFAGTERDRFNAAQTVESTLGQMNAAVDDLVAHGDKFAQPGAFGHVRGQLLKAVQAIQDFTGQKFSGDVSTLPNENANIQEIEKWHQNLMFQFKQMMDSGQRGLGVLMEAGAAIPGIENTPLGFKLLSSGLKAQADWEIGRYNFKNQWLQNPASGGTLMGSDTAYAGQLSPTDAARKEVAKLGFQMGMNTDTGQWKNKAALEGAYNSGAFGKVGSQEAKDVVKGYIRKGYAQPTQTSPMQTSPMQTPPNPQ